MKALIELFEIKNGLSSSEVKIYDVRTSDSVPYIRPSSSWDNLIVGYVNRESVKEKYIFPADTLFVSTDGQGSHSYAYVAPFEFIPNSNVAVLIPRKTMTLNEKLFYAMAITKNRFRFSYGRKPKGDRLANINLPPSAFTWTKKHDVNNYLTDIEKPYSKDSLPLGNFRKWKWFRYDELFLIKKGKRITNSQMQPGDTPCIRPIDSNNGIFDFIDIEPNHTGNTITVNYNGSVAESFYQPVEYFALDDVNILYPKFELTPFIALFIVTLIRREKYRFNYGRKWHLKRMEESLIKLPVTDKGTPDFKFIEDYVKGLPFSNVIV